MCHVNLVSFILNILQVKMLSFFPGKPQTHKVPVLRQRGRQPHFKGTAKICRIMRT